MSAMCVIGVWERMGLVFEGDGSNLVFFGPVFVDDVQD